MINFFQNNHYIIRHIIKEKISNHQSTILAAPFHIKENSLHDLSFKIL